MGRGNIPSNFSRVSITLPSLRLPPTVIAVFNTRHLCTSSPSSKHTLSRRFRHAGIRGRLSSMHYQPVRPHGRFRTVCHTLIRADCKDALALFSPFPLRHPRRASSPYRRDSSPRTYRRAVYYQPAPCRAPNVFPCTGTGVGRPAALRPRLFCQSPPISTTRT